MNTIFKIDCNIRDFDPKILFCYLILLNDNAISYHTIRYVVKL